MIHGDHFTANLFFADSARLVLLVARPRPLGNLAAHDATLDLPIEEVGASVAAPQRPVAIENGDSRPQREHRLDKLSRCAAGFRSAQKCFSEEIMFDRDRLS